MHWPLFGSTASARALTESGESRTRLKQLLDGTAVIPGITLRPLDRWNMVTTLVALSSYVDSSVSSGSTYYYVVTAVGTNSQESGYSNEVQAVIP